MLLLPNFQRTFGVSFAPPIWLGVQSYIRFIFPPNFSDFFRSFFTSFSTGNFWRTIRRTVPFFKRSAKVSALFISTKFFWFFSKFFYLVFISKFWRTNPFFKAECKDSVISIISKFFFQLLFTLTLSYWLTYCTFFRRTTRFFYLRVAKIGRCTFPPNLFEKYFTFSAASAS